MCRAGQGFPQGRAGTAAGPQEGGSLPPPRNEPTAESEVSPSLCHQGRPLLQGRMGQGLRPLEGPRGAQGSGLQPPAWPLPASSRPRLGLGSGPGPATGTSPAPHPCPGLKPEAEETQGTPGAFPRPGAARQSHPPTLSRPRASATHKAGAVSPLQAGAWATTGKTHTSLGERHGPGSPARPAPSLASQEAELGRGGTERGPHSREAGSRETWLLGPGHVISMP